MPTELVIGRHSFIDVGPPFNFYEILLVRPEASGATVEKITLTPPGDACFQPATIEDVNAHLSESVPDLLGKTNPCSISVKQLRKELDRRKKGLVFSGVDVFMQVQCQGQERVIRADILDRDMFDPTPNTPEYTSWTIGLLNKIDNAAGPGVWEKPIFENIGAQNPTNQGPESPALLDMASGKYDSLFSGTPDRPSDLYHEAHKPPVVHSVQLINSSPFQPDVFVAPKYPPIARAARVEGTVTFQFKVDENGKATGLSIDSGAKLLQMAIPDAVGNWKFSKAPVGQGIEAAIAFKLNCPPSK